jgi:predicted permease
MMGLIMGIGSIYSRFEEVTEEQRKILTSLIIYIAMPAIILNGFFSIEVMETGMFNLILITFILAVIFNCLGILIGWIVSLFTYGSKSREIALLSGLGNTGFIGIPLCAALFGPEGALLAAAFNTGVDFTIWTVGVMVLKKSLSLNISSIKAMVNIPLVTILVGLFLTSLQVKLPQLVLDTIGSLASLATPLAMIYIGILIPPLLKMKRSNYWQLSIPLMAKLILFPLVSILLIVFLPIQKEVAQIIIVQVAMPSLILSSILFRIYSGDEEYGVAATVISTLVSIATIPVVTIFGLNLL